MTNLTPAHNWSTIENSLINNVFGIDKFFKDIDTYSNAPSYPPHSVYEWNTDDGTRVYRIDVAVAGFKKDDISVTKEKDTISISGSNSAAEVPEGAVARRSGIAYRNFNLKFKVMENIHVDDVSIQDGILMLQLKEVVPEEHRPITYQISEGPLKGTKLLK